ncbi:MAG: mnmH [Flavipsychrobacter sp.]|jgi:tRNA 2-selenouridine synthase|nr:mnmH [Flavipsychrobacter sp.]
MGAKSDEYYTLQVVIQKINIEEFLSMAEKHPVIDVRSPGEYGHARIPAACTLPLFSDEERKVVGTTYKQEGREQAIKIGLDYFGLKMRKMVEEAEGIMKCHAETVEGANSRIVLVHCWRGGMRSAGVAWLLDLYGFKVYTLVGGYKAFRNWVLQQFEKQFRLKIIGGYTGSGKTKVLKELEKKGETIIDLEGIAHHKGSAFGDLGEPEQPSPEMFENTLALALSKVKDKNAIWLEDESRRIGDINMPLAFWNNMRKSPVFFLEVPFEERLKYITEEYGKFKKENLVNAIMRIRKRLGGLNAKNAINYLLEDNTLEAFRILLAYYDKFYAHGLNDRESLDELLTKVPCTTVNHAANCASVLTAYKNTITV